MTAQSSNAGLLPPHRSAAILAIGDELVLGQSLDTNSKVIAEALIDRAVLVTEHTTIDDHPDRLARAIERLAGQVDLVVLTGGLGPTADDLTREAIGAVAEEALIEDSAALDEIRAWFAGRGVSMPATNAVQARRPASARCLTNPNGTAPGLWIRLDRLGCDLLALPGPPREMVPMLERALGERLRADPDRVIATRQLQTFGLGESSVAERLAELMDRDRDPLVGTTASGGVVSVRIRCTSAGSHEEAARRLTSVEGAVRERLGAAAFHSGPEPDALVRATLDLLRGRSETLGTVESCTGGLLGEMITSVAGSSEVFVGGLITYTNELKEALAGVDAALLKEHGAVSGEVARAMAAGGRRALGSDHAVAITGVAGPGGGSAGKPVGTVWICLDSTESPPDTRSFLFRGGRDAVRAWSARAAIGMLRLRLLGADMGLLGQTATA